MDQNVPLTPVYIKANKQPISPGRSLKKVALLNILTLGLYSFRWFYLNWRDFRKEAWPNDFSPLMRTIGLFIPILGLALIHRQFKQIQIYVSSRVDIQPAFTPELLTICLCLELPLILITDLYVPGIEPLPIVMSILISTFVLVTFQRLLNTYWQQTKPDLPLQDKFTIGETLFAILGLLIWSILLLVSFLFNVFI